MTNRLNYVIIIKTFAAALKAVPDAQSFTIFRDGTCSVEFENDTTVEQSAEALAELLDASMKKANETL